MKVPRERKLRNFAGSQDDHAIEDGIVDAERATPGHTKTEAVLFVLYHLEGATREKDRLCPSNRQANKDIFEILRSTFEEGLNPIQAPRKLFERHQRERVSRSILML